MRIDTAANSCIDDTRRLVPWAEPNTAVFDDPATEQLLRGAPGGLTSEETGLPVPTLRFANPDVPAMPLLEALVTGKRHSAARCDRCPTKLQGIRSARLWVPMGESVVELHLCHHHAAVLDDLFPHTLVWS